MPDQGGNQWGGWSGAPEPERADEPGDPEPSPGAPDDGPGSDAYESDWYRSLKALAARAAELRTDVGDRADEVDGADEDGGHADGEATGTDGSPLLFAERNEPQPVEDTPDILFDLGGHATSPPEPPTPWGQLPDRGNDGPAGTVTPTTPPAGAGSSGTREENDEPAEDPSDPAGTLAGSEDPWIDAIPEVRIAQAESTLPRPSLDAPEPGVRRDALLELTRHGLPARDIERVLALTLDPDLGVRRQALAALASQADLLPGSVVQRALQDPIDQVRAEAVRLAARRGVEDPFWLLPFLGARHSPLTQQAALELLPEVLSRTSEPDDEQTSEMLHTVAALESRPNETEQDPLAELARWIGAPRLVPALTYHDDRRLGAARLLWLEGSVYGLRALATLWSDQHEEIRSTASQAGARANELEREGVAAAGAPSAEASSPVERAAEGEMLAALAGALEDPDPGVRDRARSALSDVEREAIARWVRDALRSDDAESARLAAEVAGLRGLAETAPDLLHRGAGLPDDEQEPFRRVLAALPVEPDSLLGALMSVEARRRPRAARLVWEVAGAAMLPMLDRSLSEASHDVRIALLEVLADSGDPTAIEAAGRVLASDSTPAVRVAAIDVLAHAGRDRRLRSLARALNDPDPTVRTAGVTKLPAELGNEALPLLAKALHDLDDRIWLAALSHLTSFPVEALPVVWDALKAARPEQRAGIVEALQQTGGGTLADLALQHAGSLDPEERELAITLVGHGTSEECAVACVRALQDPVPAIRRTATESLGRLRSPESVPALGASLRDPDPEVRIGAIRTLGVIDSEAVLGFLVAALADPAVEVRHAASAVLTEWSSPAVARRLAGVLATPGLRDQATELLVKMGPSAAELLVDVLLRSSSEMAPTIGSLLEQVVGIDAFAGRLASADPQQRRRAMIAIAAIGGSRAVELATGALADPDQHMRTAALEALGDLGDPRTADAVARCADSDPVPEVAATAKWVLSVLRG